MPTFIYKAKDGPVEVVHGELEAESHAVAVSRIDAMGYSPIWVREKSNDAASRPSFFKRRISARDVTVFTLQLASLIRSGVPILRALSTIVGQTENAEFRRVVQDLESDIRDGNMLSGALSRHPGLFPELYVNMVRSGEKGGVLDDILTSLANAREKEEDIRRKTQAALAYPVLIIIVGVGTIFALLTFFLPRVVALFKDYQSLPLPTRILIGVSDFFESSWYWMALALVFLLVLFKRLSSLEKGRLLIDSLKLNLPFIGKFVIRVDIARFARTLSLLLEAGISIDTALNLSANTLNNAVLRRHIQDVRRETVQQGATFSAGLKKSDLFPPLVANMAAVGEESGNLEHSLTEIAVFYEKEVDQQSGLATSLLEPILILIVGAIVGFIVSAMLLPIFRIGVGM